SRVVLHGPDKIRHLIGDGFLRGPDDMFPPGAAGDAHDAAPGVHVPVGGAQTGKGGHQVDAAVVFDLLGVVFGVPALVEETHLVPQPLDHGAAHKDGAFQRILDLAVQPDGNGGDQAVLADTGLV